MEHSKSNGSLFEVKLQLESCASHHTGHNLVITMGKTLQLLGAMAFGSGAFWGAVAVYTTYQIEQGLRSYLKDQFGIDVDDPSNTKWADSIADSLDANEDGKLDKDEVVNALKKLITNCLEVRFSSSIHCSGVNALIHRAGVLRTPPDREGRPAACRRNR